MTLTDHDETVGTVDTAGARAHWRPFSDLGSLGTGLELDRGEGARVYDAAGREYIDATGGLWFCNIGHGRAELAEAAAAQMRRLAAYSTFGRYTHRNTEQLAARLRELLPIDGAAVFFTTGGSEAVETAMKMVRRYWKATAEPDRELVVVREGAYHGMSAYGTSLAGIRQNSDGYGPLVGGVIGVARDDPEAVEAALASHPGKVAAFIGEPVIGAGGVFPPEDGYWREVQRVCDRDGVFVIADETITGFGRLGHWLGSSRFDLQPDVVTMAKGLTSGYQPMGAVAAGRRLQAPFLDGRVGVFRHGYTYSGHPVAAAVALRNLELLENEHVLDRARALEGSFEQCVGRLADHDLTWEGRAVGLMGAIEIGGQAVAADPGLPERVIDEMTRRGVLSRLLGAGRSIQLSPPLVITAEDLERMTDAIREALDAAAGGAGGAPENRGFDG